MDLFLAGGLGWLRAVRQRCPDVKVITRALQNIQSMTVGRERDEHWNQFWHWIKHARPLTADGVLVRPAEISGLHAEEAYLDLARSIRLAAARGERGTDVKVREVRQESGLFWAEWLIWYQPSVWRQGLFLAVKVLGAHGELKTMFPPEDGRGYFDRQAGAPVQ